MRHTICFFTLLAGIFLLGCDDKGTKVEQTGTTSSKSGTVSTGTPSSKHSGWWCTEHGIPESECLMCLHSEEDLKKKGDWCDKHDYCKSQCFGCDPKLKARYATQYKEKYGKDAPEPEDNPPGKNPDKK